MEIILNGLARDCCMVYLDNILVFSKTFEEHLDNLRKVFQQLQHAGLHLKPKKCSFIQHSVDTLFPQKKSQLTLRRWTPSLILQFPKMWKSTIISWSLSATCEKPPKYSPPLTKKGAVFAWNCECEKALDQLKATLTDSTTLAFPNFIYSGDRRINPKSWCCAKPIPARWITATNLLCK